MRPAFARRSVRSGSRCGNVQHPVPPRSDTPYLIVSRLEALLSDMRRLNRSRLPDTERQTLRGIANYAVEMWSEVSRAFEKAA